MKVTCRNCHFLSKHNVNRQGFESALTWESKERASGKIADYFAAECAEGIWSTRVDPHLDIEAELDRNRRRDCLAFLEARKGMTYPAARQLRERRQSAARTQRERNTIRIALAGWITAVFATALAIGQAFPD